MVSKANKEILQDKKIRFEVEVEKAAEELKVPAPKVVFYKTTSHFNEGERAHIHLETNTICISEPELETMSYDEIRNTATHEVSHTKHSGHGSDFWETQTETETSLWRPPSGVAHIVYKNQNIETTEEAPPKKKITSNRKDECSYYYCKKRKDLKKCPYCKEYFCSQHIKPREAHIGFTTETANNCHPCFPYSKQIDYESAVKKEEYGKALDRVCNRNYKGSSGGFERKPTPSKSFYKEEEIEELSQKRSKHHSKTKRISEKPKKGVHEGWIVLLISIVIILSWIGLSFFPKESPGDNLNNTAVTPEADAFSKEALEYVNQYRIKMNSPQLQFSYNLYSLVMDISLQKQQNSEAFTEIYKTSEYLKKKANLSEVSRTYSKIYFVSGEGIERFKKEFDKDFSSRSLISNSEYTHGAVGCNLDYCSLIVFSSDKDIELLT